MGLRTRPTPKRPSKPLSRSMIHRMLTDDYYTGIVTLNGVKRDGRHEALIDPELFAQVQHVLGAHKASGDRSHKHRHYLVGSLHCKICQHRLGYGRHRGNGGIYEYFSCLSRMSQQGRCIAPYFPVPTVERRVEQKYRRYLLDAAEQAAIRQALLARAETIAEAARKEEARHARRLRELTDQQQKLVHLYYDQGVSKEVLKAEQQRIEAEQAQVERWQQAAASEIADVDQALSDALLLIDAGTAPYLNGNPTERRLTNLAIYLMLLISRHRADPGPAHRLLRPAGAPGPPGRPGRPCQPPGGPQARPRPRFSGPRFAIYAYGGEGGIRTLERGFPRYAISSRARSTAPAPLRVQCRRAAPGGGAMKATTPAAPLVGRLRAWCSRCSVKRRSRRSG